MGGSEGGGIGGESGARRIMRDGLGDARIKELGDWRGKMLAHVRALIKQADPEVVEEWKWRGVPVWSHDGIICTGETYKAVVKLTFATGAKLKDPALTEVQGEYFGEYLVLLDAAMSEIEALYVERRAFNRHMSSFDALYESIAVDKD